MTSIRDERTPLLGSGDERRRVPSGDDTRGITTTGSSPSVSHRGVGRKLFKLTVEPIVFLFAIYNSMIIPILQQYMYMRISTDKNGTAADLERTPCDDLNASDARDAELQEIQQEASLWLTYNDISTVTICFFSAIFLGGYCDRGGRKIAITLPIIGGLLNIYVLVFVLVYKLPLYVVLIGGGLSGFCGGLAVFLLGVFSYLTDVTTVVDRSLRVMALEVCNMAGSAVGFVASGYLIKYCGFMGTCMMLHIVLFTNLLLVAFYLPESRAAKNHIKFWTLDHFKQSFRVYLKDDGSGRRFVLFMTLLILFFQCPVYLGNQDVMMLFTFDAPLCWDSVKYGVFRALYCVSLCVGNLLFTKSLQPALGDLPLVLLGCLSGAASAMFMAFSDRNWMVFLVPVLSIGMGLTIGLIRSFNSKVVTSAEIGAMFSWVAWLEILGSLIGNVVFNNIYRTSLAYFKGLTFIVISGVFGLTGLIVIVLMIKIKILRFSFPQRDIIDTTPCNS